MSNISTVDFSKITPDIMSAGIRFCHSISAKNRADINAEEMATILGEGVHEYQELLAKALRHEQIILPHETCYKIGLLIGIVRKLINITTENNPYYGLSLLATAHDKAPFNGLSVKQYLIDNNTIDGFTSVRDYFDFFLR